MDEITFHIAWRRPIYPAIVISSDRLYSAFDLEQLAESCVASTPIGDEIHVRVIDTKGEEFWYSPEQYILAPGFAFKKWTKKKIIETFNNSTNSKELNEKYSLKSLSNKRLDRIVNDICKLLRP